MTIDEVKNILDQTANYNISILCLKDELKELKGTELESQIKKDIEHHTEFIMKVRTNINKIQPSKVRNVMSMRYISNMTFIEISKKMSMSYQWVYELHLRGIKSLSETMSMD